MDFKEIWDHSYELSRPYWELYDKLIVEPNRSSFEASEEDKDQDVNSDYQKFIAITRQHQNERDRMKELDRSKKIEEPEIYYKDISQINYLVEDDDIEVPQKDDGESSIYEKRDEKLRKLYDVDEKQYARIRSIEMYIDENFKEKCQQLRPKYWPAIPFNTSVYLNN